MIDAGSALQRLKPVFLMSPLSVAQFLKPGQLSFDLLVIDEASQVAPEDAFGVIARAKQIVVVGDDKQLPPTNFFKMVNAGDDDSSEDNSEEPVSFNKPNHFESILTLSRTRGISERMLAWHYRSMTWSERGPELRRPEGQHPRTASYASDSSRGLRGITLGMASLYSIRNTARMALWDTIGTLAHFQLKSLRYFRCA
jgi:hypothetical protein